MAKKSGAGKSKTFPLGRDSKTGRFIPVSLAHRRPATTTIERIPKAGYGDTGRKTKAGKETDSGGPRKNRGKK